LGLDPWVVLAAVLVGCATGNTLDAPAPLDASDSGGAASGGGGGGAASGGGGEGGLGGGGDGTGGAAAGGVSGGGGTITGGGGAAGGGAAATGGALDDGGAGSPGDGGGSPGGAGGTPTTGGAAGAGGALGADGDACSASGDCGSNVCLGGFCCTPEGCADDGDPCTARACQGGTGACLHVPTGANQDGDGRTDCEEDADGILSTSKYVWNGVTASLVASGGGNCTEICLASQIASVFSSPVDTHTIHSGWEFDTDQPESQAPNSPAFGFAPPFASTVTGWRMLYRGLFWVPPSATGQYCFNVDIGSDGGSGTSDTSPDACGAIYLPDVQANAWVMNGRHQSSTSDSPPMPSESNQRTKCTTFATAGPKRIDFVYQYSSNNADNRHQLHVRYCYGDQSACTPTTLIDDAVLTPVNLVIPTCTDGVRNGGETGVDCGGPDCAAC
jgi:hypothetical protein